MALPPMFTNFVAKNGTSLQNMALLAYLRKGDEAKPFLEATTAVMVCCDVYKRLSKEDEIEQARNETILNIAKYVKEHPKARPAELQHKVEEEITLFKLKMQTI